MAKERDMKEVLSALQWMANAVLSLLQLIWLTMLNCRLNCLPKTLKIYDSYCIATKHNDDYNGLVTNKNPLLNPCIPDFFHHLGLSGKACVPRILPPSLQKSA